MRNLALVSLVLDVVGLFLVGAAILSDLDHGLALTTGVAGGILAVGAAVLFAYSVPRADVPAGLWFITAMLSFAVAGGTGSGLYLANHGAVEARAQRIAGDPDALGWVQDGFAELVHGWATPLRRGARLDPRDFADARAAATVAEGLGRPAAVVSVGDRRWGVFAVEGRFEACSASTHLSDTAPGLAALTDGSGATVLIDGLGDKHRAGHVEDLAPDGRAHACR